MNINLTNQNQMNMHTPHRPGNMPSGLICVGNKWLFKLILLI